MRSSRSTGCRDGCEIVADHHGDAFRCVYTVRFATSVYVLHVFQKKSKTGREMPALDKRLIDSGCAKRMLSNEEATSEEEDRI
jgi:phage-related protein